MPKSKKIKQTIKLQIYLEFPTQELHVDFNDYFFMTMKIIKDATEKPGCKCEMKFLK